MTKPRWAYRHIQGFVDRHNTAAHYEKTRDYPRDREMEALAAWASRRSVIEVRLAAAEFEEHALNAGSRHVRSAVSPGYDASARFAQLCYVLGRCLRPLRIIEIGVGRGASTAVLLRVLSANGQGTLDSIELPSLQFGYKEGIGVLVDPELRHRWTLHWGASADVLPDLCRLEPGATLFIHDGAHSYREQRRDLLTIVKNMQPGSVVLVDDVTSDAFLEVADDKGLEVRLFDQPPKEYPLGIGRLG